METCEVCGKPTSTIYVTQIEGANMWVCASCAKGKKVVENINLGRVETREQATRKQRGKEEEEVVEGYGEAIRKARESLTFSTKVLAERINEKESTLIRVEKEKTLPNVELTKKLEKELGIKLTAKSETASKVSIKRDEPITLWDVADRKEKAKNEEEGE